MAALKPDQLNTGTAVAVSGSPAAHPTAQAAASAGTTSRSAVAPSPSAVVVAGLSKSYGAVQGVREMSFTVKHGEIFALLGPNGAGKTTTLEILEGFRSRDAGRVEVLGTDPSLEDIYLRLTDHSAAGRATERSSR